MPVVFHRALPAHYANLMINYMIAKEVEFRFGDVVLSNFRMSYWNIDIREIAARPDDLTFRLTDKQKVNFDAINYIIEGGIFSRIDWYGYGQRIENFPSLDRSRKLFVRDDLSVPKIDAGHIVCPVRAGEVLDARHPGYTTIPVDFYSDMVERTGLTPVFMGQLKDNAYIDALRKRFPRAEYIPHRSAVEDFETIRNAENILMPVSTFAWLAAWLSYAEKIIYPVFGLFNPQLFGTHNLLPVNDPRYEMWLFPQQAAVPLERMLSEHERIKGQWQQIDPIDLVRQTYRE